MQNNKLSHVESSHNNTVVAPVREKVLGDALELAAHPDFLKCIARDGLGLGTETVIFSEIVSKINRKGKIQPRVMALTSGAIYNFLEGVCEPYYLWKYLRCFMMTTTLSFILYVFFILCFAQANTKKLCAVSHLGK